MRFIDADAIKYIDLNRDVKNDLKVFVAFKEDVDALPTIETVQGWIPCSERLPDVDVEVLTTTDWSEILIAWHRKDGTWETEEYILANDEVIAWMPLPKPYKGGDDE